MAINHDLLASLGIIPAATQGQSIFPVGADGSDPLAPLPDTTDGTKAAGAMAALKQPWRSDALLSFGAGLLSGHNFLDGLSKGATAAQDARHAFENPKRSLLADGAFTYEQYPDGSTKLVPNTDIQDYNTLQTLMSYEGKKALAAQNAKAIADRMAANNEAQMKRTEAIIKGEDRRSAAKLEADEKYHTRDLDIKEAEANGTTKDPFVKSYLQEQGKDAAALPATIEKATGYTQALDELADMVSTVGPDGKRHVDPQKAAQIGLGVGLGKRAERALTSVVPGAGAITGIDADKASRAKYLIYNVILNNNPFKGTGQVSNYEERMRMSAAPSLDMGLNAFFKAITERRDIASQGLDYARKLESKAQEQLHSRSSEAPRTSGTTSSGIHWHIVD